MDQEDFLYKLTPALYNLTDPKCLPIEVTPVVVHSLPGSQKSSVNWRRTQQFLGPCPLLGKLARKFREISPCKQLKRETLAAILTSSPELFSSWKL